MVYVHRVMFENSYYFIFGRRKTGSFDIRDIDGKNQKNVTYKKLKLSRCKRFMIQMELNKKTRTCFENERNSDRDAA